MKKKVYDFINNNPIFIKFIYGLIILNVVALILQSYEELRVSYSDFFNSFELFSVIVFTIEYVLRLWTSDLDPSYKGNSFQKRIKFIFSKFGLIDLFAILPFYLPFIFPFDLRILRILRLFRLLRIFKLGRYSKSLKTISSVLKETRSELSITLFIAFILLVLSSTLMYYFENDVQPEKFASIGHSFWWAVATLTTVGYGDVYPITGIGKILSAIIALIGIGFVALPTGIISSAFIEKIQKDRKENRICKCPNCGTEYKN
ncbi:ion transporter [Lutibacter sp. HS1-25]|uniref:ion transporter n=1 Tax=Lutibacter sp. HS1-25 TaxID=2485000 RepID=UPI0010116993|nr:ion transporter [Lutibacter sp. HS1-25]RXP46896.1 ion transporter [Lutibacter sp. HS1-25]